MLKDTYVIVTLPQRRTGDLSAASVDPDMPHEIEVAELTPAEAEDLARDRSRRLAPSMPWTLIEPAASEETDAAAEGTVTWGVDAVGAPRTEYDGSGIVVAVLDTGIDITHPAFAGVTIERRNFTAESDEDTNGHGTHCAGTIFGQDVDGLRIGVARNIDRALIAKVLGKGASTQGIIGAINWAVGEGAHVISMSLRTDFPGYVASLIKIDGLDPEPATSQALEAYRKNVNLFTEIYRSVLAQREYGDGIVLVAASGNESKRPKYAIAAAPPAAATEIVAVGALDRSPHGFVIASFSNTQVDLSAPGVGIVSARAGGGTVAMSGTSMATPHVAGIAALWAQQQRETTGQIDSRLLAGALRARATLEPLSPTNRDFATVGAGIAQAPFG